MFLGDTLEGDRLGYGEYFGLLAENDEIVDSLIDSLEMRDGLMSVFCTWYKIDPSSSVSGPDGIGMRVGNGAVGVSDPAVEPLPLPGSGVGSYLLSWGAKRYELKKEETRNSQAPEGDTLAVVSDLKFGVETGTPDWIVENYQVDVMRMQDCYPFGMEMPQRGYVSEDRINNEWGRRLGERLSSKYERGDWTDDMVREISNDVINYLKNEFEELRNADIAIPENQITNLKDRLNNKKL